MTKFLISALMLFSTQALFKVAGIEGKWTGFVDTEIGQFPLTVVYTVENDQLSGYFEEQGGKKFFDGGSISGNAFEYTTDGEGYTFTHRGVVKGDTIFLNWSNSALGEGKGMLTRMK